MKALVKFLDRAETEALLAAPDQGIWQGHRDHVLLLVAVLCPCGKLPIDGGLGQGFSRR